MRSRRRWWSAALAGADQLECRLLYLTFAALVIGGVVVVAEPSLFELPSVLDDDNVPRIIGAIAIYAFSHLLRFLRLALLIHNPAVRLRRVLQVHLLSTGLGVLLPFKLGELVRIRELGIVTGSLRTGVLAVWLERTLDAAVLIVLLLLTAVGVPESLNLLTPFLIVISAFVAITIVLITVVPANIREMMLHLVRRPSGERSVTVLRFLRAVLAMLQEAPAMLRGRVPSLILLSTLIWAAEVAVVSVAVPGVDLGLSRLSTGILSLLAGVSSGATALMPGSGERLMESLGEFGGTADVDLYRLCLVLPVLLTGAWATGAYLPWRARTRGGESQGADR